MELLRHLNAKRQITIVMVLHDLNQAIRYSDHLIVMNQGQIYASGTPGEVCTKQMLEDVYGLSCSLGFDEDGMLNISTMRLCKELPFAG